ncbi:MAG: tRNA (adenosine(37)-N6)-dimethylallyltransferase MiaA [Terrimonas sp.]|nr:tRNA (adenosine(37)-N6)-dimethylallyltransferase MiaA [Terrimonas sp.]OJY99099.1 MAG: tRNA (adenosine(37)-N6)-dimethylallyltransferase MiaA [Sphingobacteriales bacterium 40-81]
MGDKKTCIVIVGPTASGKTKLSLQLAEYFKTDIISADSRQCYRELNIGVAKPDEKALAEIRHYFINSHSIHDDVNAAVFETYALTAVEAIFAEKDYAVMVGGTGLYIKSFCEGMDDMPDIDSSVRESLRNEYNSKGIDWLKEMLKTHDALFYSRGEMLNPQRMLRALEVKLSTGKSVLAFHTAEKKQRPFNIIKVGIDVPREVLYEQVNKRVDMMMEAGLAEEVKSLNDHRYINALQTVGYKELFEYIDGKVSLEKAVDNIKQNTRHYAKRQMTWFRRDEEIKWLGKNADDYIRFVNDRRGYF